MAQPKLTDTEIGDLLAIPDRLERAARITEAGRRIGTLPKSLSDQRKDDLRHLRRVHMLADLSESISLAKSGICRLAPSSTLAAEEASSA